MPIYEYRCGDCKKRVSILFRSFSATGDPRCPNCGGANLSRLVSRVTALKSEEARMEALADPSAFGDVDENDPKSMAKWMKRMGSELGEDAGDIDQMVEEAMEEESGAGKGETEE